MKVAHFTETRTTNGIYVEADSVSYIGFGANRRINGSVHRTAFRVVDGVLIGKVKVTKLKRHPDSYSLREVGPTSLGRPVVYLSGASALIIEGHRISVADFYRDFS